MTTLSEHPKDLQDYNVQRPKVFFESFLTMKFFTPKFMKIRCYLRLFSTFGGDFYVPNFNTMELPNFLEKNQRLQHQIQVVPSMIISFGIMHIFLLKIKIKIQDFMDKIIYFVSILPISP
jgi:hypothetical protein